ncbi:hypothetical protein [Actinomadura rudentiformis]|uniref:Tat pathway signal sequence domain protein n=1 Tax=Actinomadura rudentiformis TaxID=359158 RepID=A0A6H9ZD22_9ACTN|nr:hypothetical protein [Actinomadura rudentiformis]KAB2352439.1 hypothetical protein F8566_01780 [Actinomadura rudentiformis]
MSLPESELGRRQILQSTLGITAAAALGTTGLLTTATPARAGTRLPPVPGMLGDRRANELWYQLDEVTLYNQPQELKDAYAALAAELGERWQRAIVLTWLEVLESGDYPDDFTDYVAAVRWPLQVLSRVQLDVFDAFYRPGSSRLVSAFSWFGQGVLYDPRRKEVHTMNGDPPMGYRAWHIFSRAMMFLGIDRSRWRAMIPLNAFAGAVQLTAKPDMYHVNPPLPRETVRRLARSWLPRTPERLDTDFRGFPWPTQQTT